MSRRWWSPALLCRWLVVLGAIALAVASPPTALSQQPKPPVITALDVGFNNHYKIGVWTPVRVTFRGGDQPLTGTVEAVFLDGDGTKSRVVANDGIPVQLLPGQDETVALNVRFGLHDSNLTILFRIGGQTVVRRTFEPSTSSGALELPWGASSDEQLIVSVGADIGIERVVSSAEYRNRFGQTAAVVLADARDLPTRWYGYEGVDALVLTTSRRDIYTSLSESSAAWHALDTWVRLGGKVIITAGPGALDVLAGQTPLSRLLPGTIRSTQAVRQTTAFESFSGASVRVPRPVSAPVLQIPLLENVRGVVALREASVPLVVRAPHELGEIVFVAADLDRRPFVDWEGLHGFVEKLLLDPGEPARDSDAARSMLAGQLGLTDLAGQLRGALDEFPGVRLIPFSVVALLVFVYIVLIGPVDYFFVRKVLGRMEWTWVTFPVIVLLVSTAAYAIAYATKGTQLRTNQVDLVDVDIASGTLRGTSWLNLFSPQTATYDLSYTPHGGLVRPEAGAETIITWLGLPGHALGGMQAGTPTPTFFAREYSYTPPLDAMLDVPVTVWSTKSLVARWSGETDAPVSADLEEVQANVVSGAVEHHLPSALENCILVYGRYAYDLKTLEPGVRVRIDPIQRDNLQSVLKNIRVIKVEKRNEYIQQSTPWDPSNRDVPAIVREMMFYEATGGFGYAGLWNRYQDFVDLSSHLMLGRAILVGMVSGETAGEYADGEKPLANADDRRWTFYRFVLPVTMLADDADTNRAARPATRDND